MSNYREAVQATLYRQAEEIYINRMADQADAALDRRRETPDA